jgi:hypothetical protein
MSFTSTVWTGRASRKLLEEILGVDTEDEVIAILTAVGLWEDEAAWRLYGDEPDNFSPAGAQQRNPEAALVEKIVNSVDASLMARVLADGVDPRSEAAPQSPREAVAIYYEQATPGHIADYQGAMANWPRGERTKVSRDITVALTGKRGRKPSISIADAGEGQSPDSLPHTILSLMRGNKKTIAFVQGKWNMGGTGALRFSGHYGLQLVLSKRHPEIAQRDGSSSDWGWTIVRRDYPEGKTRSSAYRYLAPLGAAEAPGHGEVLRFAAESVPMFPVVQQPYARNAKWGTLIKLYEYGTRYDGPFFRKGLLQRFDMMLPGLILPVRLHECRGYAGKERSFETTLTGLEVRLRAQEDDDEEDKEGRLEPGFPNTGVLTIGGEPIKQTIYAFKRGKEVSYKSDQGVLFVVNGQTQAVWEDRFFRRSTVGMDYVAKSLLVVLDCTDLSEGTKENLFMNSRDRLADGPLAQRIERQLAAELRDHPGLQALRNRRQQEETARLIGDSKPVEDVIKSMLKRSPSLVKLFFPGTKLANPFAPVDVPVAQPFQGERHPTYFRFKDHEYGHVLHRTAHLDQRFRITLETNAANDYFGRPHEPGRRTVECSLNGAPVVIDETLNLFDGYGHLSLTLPPEAKVGDELKVVLTVTDDTLIEPFVNEAQILVARAVEHRPGKPGQRRHREEKDPEGPTEQRPGGIQIPEPTEVHKPEWKERDMTAASVMRAKLKKAIAEGKKPGVGDYDLFLNMDNEFLGWELKSRAKNADTVRYRYKFGMTLAAIAAIRYSTLPRTQEEEPDNDAGKDTEDLDIPALVAATTDALAPVLLPMIDVLGDLDVNAPAGDEGDAEQSAAEEDAA